MCPGLKIFLQMLAIDSKCHPDMKIITDDFIQCEVSGFLKRTEKSCLPIISSSLNGVMNLEPFKNADLGRTPFLSLGPHPS